jgi:4-hydroxy-2-oxoheptanedioate aldolase
MRENRLRALKRARSPIVNGWLSIAAPYAAELMGHAGFDALTVDCQHGMIGFDAAVAMLQAISSTPAVPLVRPSANNPAEMMRWLDAGAYGLICPMISTAEQAAAFVSACRYPPVGTRSFGPARGLLYGGADYGAHANDTVLALAMVETAEGLANLDAILATPGLDGIFVGPNDLALALGCAARSESDEPVMVEAVERIRAGCARAGLISGIFCSGGAAAARRIAEGFDLVTPGNDAGTLKAAGAQAVDAARAKG